MFKRVVRVVLSKTFAFAILALLQVAIFVGLIVGFASAGAVAYTLITIITVLVLVYVLEKDDLNPAYKLMWTLIIILMPVAGTLFYLMWGHRHVPRRQQHQLEATEQRAQQAIQQQPGPLEALAAYDKRLGLTAQYLLQYANAPVYSGCETEYYPIGEDFFSPYLEALRGAKKYIFMEYFIYQEGYMWDTVLGILREKVAEGVDVRVIFDGFGSLFTLPVNYDKKLREYGIKCYPFSPLTLTLHVSDYAMLNHRDHRKMTVVDGEVAFSGGLNMADEYINVREKYGEWKDTAFRVRGDAVYSFTVTFLKAWDFVAKTQTRYDDYRPLPAPAQDGCPPMQEAIDVKTRGLVQPYDDTPLDGENVSENAYLKVISYAKNYVYISTPYLILDHEMITSLTLAAKSGVDVRILTPAIPDKPTVFLLTQSYYPTLIQDGVKIYEYTPGFNHAKMYVCDDEVAIIGSANMDYRSLYLHFENCSMFYGGSIVADAKRDMEASFARAHLVTLEETRQVPLFKRLLRSVVRFLAPML